MTVQIRGSTDADLTVLIRLLNEENKGSYEFAPYDRDGLRSWIREGKLRILIAEENDTVLGSAAYHDGHWGEEVEWLAIREAKDRKLIESMLVKGVEKHVKRETIFVPIDEESPRASDWIERGYHVEGGLYHMVARLDGVKPLSSVPQGIVIRSLRPNEEKRLVEAVNAGFGWERLKVGIIQQWKTDCPSFNEGWVHVAEADDTIVSVVASREDANYHKRFGGHRGYLGPAATLPEFRGKNLASALTRRAMNVLYEKGMRAVVLYTSDQNTSSLALLRKLEFGIGHHWQFMRKRMTPEASVATKDQESEKHQIC